MTIKRTFAVCIILCVVSLMVWCLYITRVQVFTKTYNHSERDTSEGLGEVSGANKLIPYIKNTTFGFVTTDAVSDTVRPKNDSEIEEKEKHGDPKLEVGESFTLTPTLGSVSSVDACKQVQKTGFMNRKWVTHHTPHIDVSCNKLRAGDLHEQKRVKSIVKNWHNSISDSEYFEDFKNCSKTVQDFVTGFYSSPSESNFPIAFEMLIFYKEGRIQQYLRLLKFLYRPQNVYCIHIDKKSPEWWTKEIQRFASCFPNIIIAEQPVEITYATATILYGHFSCLKDLVESNLKWEYVITLHSTELPLVTNKEMVDGLKLFNGSNFIPKGVDVSTSNSQLRNWITYKVLSIRDGTWVKLSKEKLDPVPYNIQLYKSGASANSALSRMFVEFIFKDEHAIALADWLKDVHSAVEFFFSTVNHFPTAPGGFATLKNKKLLNAELAHREWSHDILKNHKLCVNLKVVHDICIVSAGDLPRLSKASKEKEWWFFNKYFINYDHVVMDCMEELLLDRNIHEYKSDCENHSS